MHILFYLLNPVLVLLFPLRFPVLLILLPEFRNSTFSKLERLMKVVGIGIGTGTGGSPEELFLVLLLGRVGDWLTVGTTSMEDVSMTATFPVVLLLIAKGSFCSSFLSSSLN